MLVLAAVGRVAWCLLSEKALPGQTARRALPRPRCYCQLLLLLAQDQFTFFVCGSDGVFVGDLFQGTLVRLRKREEGQH